MQLRFIIKVLSLALQLTKASAAPAQLHLRAVHPAAGNPSALHADKRRESELADLARLARDASEEEKSKRQLSKSWKNSQGSASTRTENATHLGKSVKPLQTSLANSGKSKTLASTHSAAVAVAAAVEAESGKDLLRKWSENRTDAHTSWSQGLHAGMKSFANGTAGLHNTGLHEELHMPGHESAETALRGAQVLEHWSQHHMPAGEHAQATSPQNSVTVSMARDAPTASVHNGLDKIKSEANHAKTTVMKHGAADSHPKRLRMPAAPAEPHAQQKHQVHLPSPGKVSKGLHVLESWRASHEMPTEKAIVESPAGHAILAAPSKSTSLHSIADDLKDLHSTMHQWEASAAHDAMQSITAEQSVMRLDRAHHSGSVAKTVAKGKHMLEAWSAAHKQAPMEKAIAVAAIHSSASSVRSSASMAASEPLSAGRVARDLKDLVSTEKQLQASNVHDAMHGLHDSAGVSSAALWGLGTLKTGQRSLSSAEDVSRGAHILEGWSEARAAGNVVKVLLPNSEQKDTGLEEPQLADKSLQNRPPSQSVATDLKNLLTTEQQLKQSNMHAAMRKFDFRANGIASTNKVKVPSANLVSKGELALEHWSKNHRQA